MPSARVIIWLGLAGVATACATLPPPEPLADLMPREIRIGAAEMAIAGVEQTVSRQEVSQVVGEMVAQSPVCLSWPTLWLEGDERRTPFLVRFDLMARDWGADVAANSRARMQEFVDLGFLTQRERSEISTQAIEFALTREGWSYLQGSPHGRDSERPRFCPPSQRRLVEITNLEWGQFSCGSLRVSFTHAAEAWPDWARTESARARLGALGTLQQGTVSLARQWYRRDSLPAGVRNGQLRSLCYDAQRRRFVGDDLQLQAGEP